MLSLKQHIIMLPQIMYDFKYLSKQNTSCMKDFLSCINITYYLLLQRKMSLWIIKVITNFLNTLESPEKNGVTGHSPSLQINIWYDSPESWWSIYAHKVFRHYLVCHLKCSVTEETIIHRKINKASNIFSPWDFKTLHLYKTPFYQWRHEY